MSEADAAAVERIIANTINKTARGDPDALAARIVADLGEAGYRIVPANGKKDTLLGLQPDKYRMEQLYRSPNGDTWFLARDPATGLGTVRHQANASSGGQVTDIEIHRILNRRLSSASLAPRSSIRRGPRLRTNRRPRTPGGNGPMQS